GGARIANASWGAPSGGEYDSLAQEFDRLVRDARPDLPGNQELPYVVAAGNQTPGVTALLSPATAKNVITVGASESVRPYPTSIGNPTGADGCGTPNTEADDPQQIPSWSLGGPTADGRRKPDLVAPGTHVMGARSQLSPPDWIGDAICGDEDGDETDPLTIASSGTSHAAPVVAGLAAIAREALVRGGGAPPSPALLKAMLIGGAQPLPGLWPGGRQGFGLARLRGADPRGRWLRDQQDLLTEAGQSVSWTVTPADTGAPLAITLAWTDAPGLTVGAPWVNDLDLEVEAGGRLYRGNGLQNGVSVPDAAPERKDNVETVVLPAGTGPVTVRVRAANLPGNGVPGNADATDQDFALATTGTGIGAIEPVRQSVPAPPAAVPAPAPPAPPAPTAAAKPRLSVVGPSTKRCLSRRVIRLRLRPAPGVKLLSARITLRGHRAVRLTATRATTSVSLRGLPRGRFTLRITARTADGRTITLRRTYRTCAPKRR
ncbi:MAG: S8 family serine peptidase, partial [Solirubrobacteraceae bacterium]|nr:S8 family serine peptidase [Solirubrobacteraceae bacterium]